MKIGVGLVLLFIVCLTANEQYQATVAAGSDLTFVATVKQIGPPPMRDIGDVDVYQLVKYEVDRVCEGKYEEKEIVVDHLLPRHDQLKNLKVGQKICLSVIRSKDIGLRYNSEGIRSASDTVKFFYISQGIKPAKLCSCSQ